MPTIAEAHQLAREALEARDAARARFIYEQILKAVPEEAYALSGLASLAFDAGRLSQAKSYLERAIATLADDPALHNQLSMANRALGRTDEALIALRNAVKLAPESPELVNNLGVMLKECGQYDEAASAFGRALALKPDYVDAEFNLANALAAAGRDLESIAAYCRAIELAPHLPEQHWALAVLLERIGRLEESLASLRRALDLKPEFADALYLMDRVLEKLGRHEDAQDAYLRAIELAPDVSVLKDDQVITRVNRPAFEQAVVRLQRALAIKPDLAGGHLVLAGALRRLDRLADAEAAYRRAIELAPHDARAHSELGVMLKDQRRLNEARELFDAAVRQMPDSAAAHQNLALLRLLQGDFVAGFAGYESRWRLPDALRLPEAPRWTGDALPGGTVLLLAEKGFGDVIQFVRYARLVKERSGARVVLHCNESLHALLSTVPGIDSLSSGPAVEQKCDYYAPLLSLPSVFGTTVETIPAEVPYLFADPDLVDRWRRTFEAGGWRPEAAGQTNVVPDAAETVKPKAADRGGVPHSSSSLQPAASGLFRVGIAWQGNPAYQSDARRSIPLTYFAALSRCPRVQLISLQKGFGREQLAEPGGDAKELREIIDLGAQLDQQGDAFVDTAAVIANLDLIITSDTAIAHLAGALGAQVWVALAYVPDWRWMLWGDRSPWYPTMRLFRQSEYGNWSEVFDRIALELSQLSDAGG